MVVDEVSIPSKTNEQFLLKLLHNKSISTEPLYLNHSHAELEIVMFKNGEGVYLVNKTKEYAFKSGDIFIFGSNEDHIVTQINPRTGTESICLHFNPHFIWSPENDLIDIKYLRVFLNRGNNFEHILKAELPTSKIIKNALHEIENEFDQKLFEYELMIKVKLLTVLIEINRYRGNSQNKDALDSISNQYLQRIEKSMRYIDYNINTAITLDHLAQIAAISRSNYSRLFKMLNGVSPWDYLTTKRIELAQKYLLNSNMPIIEIAIHCGFNNSTNFNRSFKKITGSTPSQFRKIGPRYRGAIHELTM
ncbi:MAG: AraC family transcriptional regulator [Oscillospiraceae bacterium]|jgi:AraC-like DNA-binding protein|nr:AraC family transcriptional regulator [Oscillospiraceae bacterium]